MAVSFSADGNVGTILLDKPPANSYDLEYMQELRASIEAANDSQVRVVVLRSASEKFFCAGADIKRFAENTVEQNMDMIRFAHETLSMIAKSPKLFVAFVAGHALGGGLEMPLACDIRYAQAGRFKMGTPEVTLGVLPGNGGTQRLPRLIGLGPALELLTTGRAIDVDEALRIGLVSKVFEDAESFDKHIATLAALPPIALANIKRAAFEGIEKPLDEGLALERDLMEELYNTKDADEGFAAFAEKRPAEFRGE
jgi:enoyl-CoA hydratase/carnithine racemase